MAEGQGPNSIEGRLKMFTGNAEKTNATPPTTEQSPATAQSQQAEAARRKKEGLVQRIREALGGQRDITDTYGVDTQKPAAARNEQQTPDGKTPHQWTVTDENRGGHAAIDANTAVGNALRELAVEERAKIAAENKPQSGLLRRINASNSNSNS